MARVHNFCAGPCTLPESVIAELADELPDLDGAGMSLIEMSHRDPVYDRIHHETLDLLRELTGAPDDFSILLLQGGASLQFAMVPMNLLASDGTKAGHVISGSWAKKAAADAKLVGNVYEAWSGADEGFCRMPTADELTIEPDTIYLHVTSNETIGGIRMAGFDNVGTRLVADMSSDYLTRRIPWDLFDVIYGGAQKNLGPAGLAVVFVRNSVAEASPESLPAFLRFSTHSGSDSLSNTPPVFAIWATGKMLKWMKANGGVDEMERRAESRSKLVYDAIDGSGGFYRSPVEVASRSHTNIVFRLTDEDLEPRFLADAEKEGLMNLKGHRSVGGIRASVYNALPTGSVEALVSFMADFSAGRG